MAYKEIALKVASTLKVYSTKVQCTFGINWADIRIVKFLGNNMEMACHCLISGYFFNLLQLISQIFPNINKVWTYYGI